MSPRPHRPSPASRGEAGSAYIVVLLVLVILAIFGIALSLITQTESQVGSNERTINRTFYAADAATERALMRAIDGANAEPETVFFTDSGQALLGGGKLELGTQVEVSAVWPIESYYCDLCQVNDSGYSNPFYRKVTHAVTARATRFATLNAGGARTPVAQKTVSVMYEVHPAPEAIPPLRGLDPAARAIELAKIKF
jgi:Tfp pilus assembly protein PilX